MRAENAEIPYPKMKRLSRKVLCLYLSCFFIFECDILIFFSVFSCFRSADVWKLLELDSCGYVRKDIEGGGQDEHTEIQIVVWPPARE